MPFLAHAETVDFHDPGEAAPRGHLHPLPRSGEAGGRIPHGHEGSGLRRRCENYAKETIVPKDPEASPVYWMTTEPADSADLMPPKKPLSAEQQAILKAWIAEGANWPEGVTLEEKPRMDFKNNILPLLSKGGPFKAQEQEMLRLWVEQGAVWPKDFKIGGASEAAKGGLADNVELVKVIRENILATTKEKAEGDMKDYTGTIPKTGVKYDMVAIKGGEFMMGSPADEKGRSDDEGPSTRSRSPPSGWASSRSLGTCTNPS